MLYELYQWYKEGYPRLLGKYAGADKNEGRYRI